MSENPMFLRQRLRDRLKRAREAAGMTQQQVAEAFGWSPSKVIRIENGKIGVNITDAMALVQHYGISDEEGTELVSLAKAARQPSWYAPYKNVMTPQLEAYISYEESASIVRNFERNVVPGLLQTEEYARAILGEFRTGRDLELSVELRMRRQQALDNTEAEFFFILDESVLRRTIGSDSLMQQQLEALLRINEYPNVQIQYVPFRKGIYPLFRTPYQIFEFSGGSDDLVAYLENPDGDVLLSESMPRYGARRSPADYLDVFWQVEREVAESIMEGVPAAA
ncbi:helix-turn-helix domain-containing protein [Streptomyces sp. P9-2]|uniref:helix-turn-helix domain-containing protein n=1 Tax=Streptomyces sp. P9-2 TaxID=3423201 RepID=UPI003F745C38